MISINKYDTIPIFHQCSDSRTGKAMTLEEIHEFGLGLLTVLLYKQGGNLIKSNNNISQEYPHLIAENPEKQLMYIWIKTEFSPNIPKYQLDHYHEDRINLANQFNAIPVFAGIILICDPTDGECIPKCGAGYYAKFTGFKDIRN